MKDDNRVENRMEEPIMKNLTQKSAVSFQEMPKVFWLRAMKMGISKAKTSAVSHTIGLNRMKKYLFDINVYSLIFSENIPEKWVRYWKEETN